jgi:hypothetical protein
MRSALRIVAAAIALAGCADPPPPRPVAPRAGAILGTFTLREHLGHPWDDEVVHFDFDVPDLGDLSLTNDRGEPVLFQLDGVTAAAGRRRGRVWTVASLAPRSQIGFVLRSGVQQAAARPGAAIAIEDGAIVLVNDRVAVSLPRLPGALATPVDLRALPAPIRAVRTLYGPWLGGSAWVNEGAPVLVTRAESEILERGPVRVSVRQSLSFAGGGAYTATISLGAAQEVAQVVEDADVRAPKAAMRLSMRPGLGADRVLWQTQYKAPAGANPWAVLDTEVTNGVADGDDRVVAQLRPWSFNWLPSITQWAGFHAGKGPDPALAGVLALRPSRWSPPHWDGFDRTAIPITARPGGALDLTFVLDARRADHPEDRLHREWALTAGLAAEHVTTDGARAKLRRLLIKHGELPLDEVKDFAFDFHPAAREHPSLLFGPADVARVRRQAKTDPQVAAEVARAITTMNGCGGCIDRALAAGPEACFDAFVRHHFHGELPTAYLGSDDPRWGRFLGAVIEGLAKRVVRIFLEAPERPSLGAYGPWYSEYVTQLALMLDLVAGTPYLSREKEEEARSALVLGAEVLAHPDFWNTDRGLASANPNMTAAIYLPRGLLAFALAGHPHAEGWLHRAEAHFESELATWISPGGAWIENPHYQLASLDSLFMLASVLKRAGLGDPFSDRRLASTLDYLGFLLTPPDPRFAAPKGTAPMILPAIGDAFAGDTSLFNGWMASAISAKDPAASARQQWFWKAQNRSLENAGRATGLALALTDPALPAEPPAERAGAFPGFGNVMRSSWTDPRASYVAHRTGPNIHHYHADAGSFVYYAKGAPLSIDWGNYYSPRSRGEPFYHSMVSFGATGTADELNIRGEHLGLASLPAFVSVSHGKTRGQAGHVSERHLLFVESADPMGANYLVLHDTTEGPRGLAFHENVWALSEKPEVRGADIHFPGKLGVDLEVSFVAPRAPEIAVDHWAWQEAIPRWGPFSEEQWGVHATQATSPEGFFVVLYPRAGKERAPRVTALAGGAAARVEHGEGRDVVLCSPGHPATVREGGAELSGEIAFARRYRSGALRLAVLSRGRVEMDGYRVESASPIALEIVGSAIYGVSAGEGGVATITLPAGFGSASLLVDGAPLPFRKQSERTMIVTLPAGAHRLSIRRGA